LLVCPTDGVVGGWILKGEAGAGSIPVRIRGRVCGSADQGKSRSAVVFARDGDLRVEEVVPDTESAAVLERSERFDVRRLGVVDLPG
jgi:hypothetical protein